MDIERITKMIKEISRYSEASIAVRLAEVMNGKQRKRAYAAIEEMHALVTSKPRDKKRSALASSSEIFSSVLDLLRAGLQRYEANESIEKVTVKLNFAVDYAKMELDDFASRHQELVAAINASNVFVLFVRAERGRMYQEIRNRYAGGWVKFCEVTLGICSKTAKRHIDWFRLTKLYPRLFVCEVGFEAIMSNLERLLKKLNQDEQLKTRLMQPIKKTQIELSMEMNPEDMPTKDKYTFFKSTSKDAQYKPGWELADAIEDKLNTSDETGECGCSNAPGEDESEEHDDSEEGEDFVEGELQKALTSPDTALANMASDLQLGEQNEQETGDN